MKWLLPFLTLLAILTAGRSGLPASADGNIRIGAKTFTESVILGELAVGLVRDLTEQRAELKELGGSRILWDALVKGNIDLYPEYTGTISREILAGTRMGGPDGMRKALASYGVGLTRSLGFNNNYALGMKKEKCRSLGIRRMSDLRAHPELVFGFSNEFMARLDGWPGLRVKYGLPQKHVRGMDHDLAYRGLLHGSIDVTDLYTTDPEIAYYDLCVLDDDAHYFVTYDAVFLYRLDLDQRAPGVIAAIEHLQGRISGPGMMGMNEKAKLGKVPPDQVAADFLAAQFSLYTNVAAEPMWGRLWRHTKEHLYLVAVSLFAAILISIPLGILAEKSAALGPVILGFVGMVQTIPSLALLVFMIPLLGIGGPPAIAALFLYSLLPIVRNTHNGLRDIPPAVRESAEALGLPAFARLRLVELPVSSRQILAGIKTSAVINVGTATLGALIGAGGYGQPILTGIRLDDLALILQGAVPAALLALAVQGLFDLAEFLLVPKGLRLRVRGAGGPFRLTS